MPAPATHFTVKLPVKPHIKKFVVSTFGPALKLDWNHPIGGVLLSLLQTNSFIVNMNRAKKEKRIQLLSEHIVFYGPISTMRKTGDSLSPDRIIAANRVLEAMFVEKMSLYCEKHKLKKDYRPGIDNQIIAFCNSYGLELDVDVTYDALKKAEYRYRKNMEKNVATFVPSSISLISTAL